MVNNHIIHSRSDFTNPDNNDAFEGTLVCSSTSENIGVEAGNFLGVVLSIAHVFFNASSFVIRKMSMRRLQNYSKRQQPRFRFMINPLWILGGCLGTSGDVAQALAIQLVSHTVVVAIGMGNGLVAALLKVTLLNEPTSLLVVLLCMLTVTGNILLVMGIPAEMQPFTIVELELYLSRTGFIVYALLTVTLTALLMALYTDTLGKDCILFNVFICSFASVPYAIAVKAIIMTVSEIGEVISVRTVLWSIVVGVSFMTNVLYQNMALEQFDSVRISQLYSCCINICVTTTMILLTGMWAQMTVYHWFLMANGAVAIGLALFGFVAFQKDHYRSDAAVRVAIKILQSDSGVISASSSCYTANGLTPCDSESTK